MRRTRGQVINVDSLQDFDRRLSSGARSLSGWRLRSLDLSARGRALRSVEVAGALFLGCRLQDDDEDFVRARGAVVFPTVPDSPVDTYRAALYTPDELYDAADYAQSFDARVYAWSQRVGADGDGALAESLHDHSIGLSLERWIHGRRLVGVMGGHDAVRGDVGYADGARLGRMLAQNHTVATGGGPGAMDEALCVLRELLRRRVLHRADGAGGQGVLDADIPGLAAAEGARPWPCHAAARAPGRHRGGCRCTHGARPLSRRSRKAPDTGESIRSLSVHPQGLEP